MQKRTHKEAYIAKRQAEFLAAYEEHADILFRHCLLRVRNKDMARDIVQEAYSRTWLYMSQGKKIDYIRAFLFRIANNLIVDGSRKKKMSSLDALIDEDGFEPIDESIKAPIDSPALNRALKLLEDLDESYRSVITMRFMEELTPREIARTLGITENVVSVRLHRGIDKLKKAMGEHTSEK
jgi:RNA polymerase sigma-70 factor, ECF subfamily